VSLLAGAQAATVRTVASSDVVPSLEAHLAELSEQAKENWTERDEQMMCMYVEDG
jgi:hypothetical protein